MDNVICIVLSVWHTWPLCVVWCSVRNIRWLIPSLGRISKGVCKLDLDSTVSSFRIIRLMIAAHDLQFELAQSARRLLKAWDLICRKAERASYLLRKIIDQVSRKCAKYCQSFASPARLWRRSGYLCPCIAMLLAVGDSWFMLDGFEISGLTHAAAVRILYGFGVYHMNDALLTCSKEDFSSAIWIDNVIWTCRKAYVQA